MKKKSQCDLIELNWEYLRLSERVKEMTNDYIIKSCYLVRTLIHTCFNYRVYIIQIENSRWNINVTQTNTFLAPQTYTHTRTSDTIQLNWIKIIESVIEIVTRGSFERKKKCVNKICRVIISNNNNADCFKITIKCFVIEKIDTFLSQKNNKKRSSNK